GVASTLLTLSIGGMAIYGLTRFPSRLRWASMAFTGVAAGCFFGTILFSQQTAGLLFGAGAVLSLALALGFRQRGPIMSSYSAIVLMLATRILPPIVVVLPLYIAAEVTGLRDSLTALVLTY